MKRPPMFLMMLLATVMSDQLPADAAQGIKPTPGNNVKGLTRGPDSVACDLDASHGALVSRLKPAA